MWKGPPLLETLFPLALRSLYMTAPSGDTGQLPTILLAHEKARSRAWGEKNSRALEVLLAPDYLEINWLGRFTKQEMVRNLLPSLCIHEFTISEPRLIVASPDSAILTYRALGDLAMGGQRMAGTFHGAAHYAKREGKWVLLLWQITPSPC